MAPDWISLTTGSVPLDGTALTTKAPDPGVPVRLTLEGEIAFSLTEQVFDPVDADTPESLIQVEPGQWHMIEARPDEHLYVFEPSGSLTQPARVFLDVQGLAQRQGLEVDQVKGALTGHLGVELEAALPVPPPSQVPLLLGGALVLAAVGVATAFLVRNRQRMDRDLEALLEEIRRIAADLEQRARGREADGPRATQQVPALVSSAERLCASARALRSRYRRSGIERLQARVKRLERDMDEGAPARQEAERELALVSSLAAEEQRLTEKLHRIRDALESLRQAWVAVDEEAGQETEETRILLEEAQAEITAVHSTVQESRETDGRDT